MYDVIACSELKLESQVMLNGTNTSLVSSRVASIPKGTGGRPIIDQEKNGHCGQYRTGLQHTQSGAKRN